MTGRVVHFEIPFEDGDRARGFYADVFGWNIMNMPEMNYTMVSTGPTDEQGPPSEPGFINGGMLQRDAPVGSPVIVVDVEDIDGSLEKIEKLGGSTVIAKQAVADMGFSAYFKDPEGNLMGLWQTA
ncbi:MAG TPA: VOC family protein [Nocardioidaceae bacterium]|nr:VOC family protein [Nocardioidaceae bacterium]